MDTTYWHKQTESEPLYPDLLWSRPENKRHAGKLLIIGGNSSGFATVAESYNAAVKSGAGAVRVLLPDILQKTVGLDSLKSDFAPSTPSGGFSGRALAEFLSASSWPDGVLLAGDFGRNAETAIVLERFIGSFDGQITLANDAIDNFVKLPEILFSRSNTTLVVNLSQLQLLVRNLPVDKPITFQMNLLQLIETMHDLSSTYLANIVTAHQHQIIVAAAGQVSTTKLQPEPNRWQTGTAARMAVWWLQNPSRAFAALCTGAVWRSEHLQL